MTEDIGKLISSRSICPLFQPIVDVRDHSRLGFEALARGPEGSELAQPQALFLAADEAGLTRELDYLCLESAIWRNAELGLGGRLFINLTPSGLLSLGNDVDFLSSALSLAGMQPDKIVLEMTEQAICEDYQAIREAMKPIRSRGVSFAIDDLGAGYSNLRAWSELHPDFIKIDRYFIRSIDTDPLKMEFVRAIVDMARASGSYVVAEGVETAAEAAELRDAGVTYLQGFYISPPQLEPENLASETMVQRIRGDSIPEQTPTARDLVAAAEPIEPGALIGDVAALMHAQEETQVLPVVRDGRPVGILRRADLLNLLSQPLRHELYGTKPVELVMDAEPLLVESDLKLDQVSRRVTHDKQARLHEQFIVTDKGMYLGMARSIDLLRKITEEQIRAARHSNPLTALPGNVPIYDCVNDLLRRERDFVLCYVDIDHFKPFNDYYGYRRGDEALIAVGRELTRRISPRLDFVGHIGGDDFVIVFRSPDWQQRTVRAMDEIAAVIRALYDPRHLNEGGMDGRDRSGVRRRFPLLSVSVAALVCDRKLKLTAEDLAFMIAPVKSRAKAVEGNSLEIEHCSGIVDQAAFATVAAGR